MLAMRVNLRKPNLRVESGFGVEFAFLLLRGTWRRDEKIFYSKSGTEEGNIYVHMHMNSLLKRARGLLVIPTVRGWDNLSYVKELA